MKGELHKKVWAIINADKVLVMNLTYPQAQMRLDKLIEEKQTSGHEGTIVTNEAAQRMIDNQK